jgi:hypothetical protein
MVKYELCAVLRGDGIEWGSKEIGGGLLIYVTLDVTTVPWVSRDGAGGEWDIKNNLCNTLSARVGNILGPTKGDVCESVKNM